MKKGTATTAVPFVVQIYDITPKTVITCLIKFLPVLISIGTGFFTKQHE